MQDLYHLLYNFTQTCAKSLDESYIGISGALMPFAKLSKTSFFIKVICEHF